MTADPTAASRPRRGLSGALAGTDLPLVVATLLLCLAGAASVYAATRNGLLAAGRNPQAYLDRDVVNIGVGLALAVPVALIDFRQLRPYTPILYAAVLLGLLAVLTPLGSSVNGAHAWFSAGPVQLEPSEFAKIAVVLAAAGVLTDHPDVPPSTRPVATALGLAALPTLLVLAEPALGVAIIVAVICLGVLAISGAPARWLVGLVVLALAGGALAFGLHLLKPYQRDRFTAFTNPDAHTVTSYQLHQSQIAIGSGGLTGKGFLGGGQTDGGYVPEQQTDFVFTVVGEEAGFAGSAGLLAVFGLLFWRMLDIARRTTDPYGRTVAAGIATWLAAQTFINVGMTLGIMPVTGVPLPFVSYGGSAMFVDLVAVALLVNIGRTDARPRVSLGRVRL